MSARLTGQHWKKRMEVEPAKQDEQFETTTTTKTMTSKVNSGDHRRLNSKTTTGIGSGNLLLFLSNNNNNNKMNLIAAILTILTIQLTAVAQLSLAAMNLPDGIENILGFVPKSTFQCERDGYFGDIDNDCRIFHLCQRQVHPSGRTEWRHWTYACGNQTMFNQLTLTCAFVDEAIPCKHASQFQYLNEVIHRPAEPFLTDADVTSGISYYSNRVMSDGARARAFEDSQLLAQIGGGQQQQQQQQQATHTNSLTNFNSNNNNHFQQQGSSIALDSTSFSNNNNANQPNGHLPRQSLPAITNIDTGDRANNNNNDNNINFIGQPGFLPNENTFQPLFNSRQQQQQQQQVRASRQQQQQQQQPLPEQPLPQQQFQSLQAARLPIPTQPAGQQANAVVAARGGLIENHAFQLQHHSSPTQTAFVSPNQQALQPVQANGLPPPPPPPLQTTTTTPQTTTTTSVRLSNADAFNNQFTPISATTTLQSVQRQQEHLALPSNSDNINLGQSSPPSSFTFSISTNHQANAQSEPASVSQAEGSLVSPAHNNQRQSSIFQLNSAQAPLVVAPITPTTTTTTPTSIGPALATTAGFTTAFTQPQTIQTPAVATTTLASAPLTTFTTASELPLGITDAQPVPVFTTQRLQPPTTTVASALVLDSRPLTTTASSSSSLRRREQPQPQQPRQHQHQQRDRAGNDLHLERAHVAFQSTRLSAQAANQQARPADTPIVMRRSLVGATPVRAAPVSASSDFQATNQASPGPTGPAAAGSQSFESAQPWSANQFWRRSFDTQLLTPKFESMLTRRRV